MSSFLKIKTGYVFDLLSPNQQEPISCSECIYKVSWTDMSKGLSGRLVQDILTEGVYISAENLSNSIIARAPLVDKTGNNISRTDQITELSTLSSSLKKISSEAQKYSAEYAGHTWTPITLDNLCNKFEAVAVQMQAKVNELQKPITEINSVLNNSVATGIIMDFL